MNVWTRSPGMLLPIPMKKDLEMQEIDQLIETVKIPHQIPLIHQYHDNVGLQTQVDVKLIQTSPGPSELNKCIQTNEKYIASNTAGASDRLLIPPLTAEDAIIVHNSLAAWLPSAFECLKDNLQPLEINYAYGFNSTHSLYASLDALFNAPAVNTGTQEQCYSAFEQLCSYYSLQSVKYSTMKKVNKMNNFVYTYKASLALLINDKKATNELKIDDPANPESNATPSRSKPDNNSTNPSSPDGGVMVELRGSPITLPVPERVVVPVSGSGRKCNTRYPFPTNIPKIFR